jgi:hypothetical protein
MQSLRLRLRLTNSQMGIDTSITSRAGQILVLAVRDVKVSLGVTVFLGETEIDDVDLIASLSDAHEKVIRLDVPMNERLGMDVLNPRDELICEEQHSLEREFAVAKVEKILQAGSQKIQHHGIVVTLGPIPTDKRNANAAGKRLVDSGLVLQLGVLGLDALELDGDFFSGDYVRA